MSMEKGLSHGWLIILNIMLLQVAAPLPANAMPVEKQIYTAGQKACPQMTASQNKTVPIRIRYEIKNNDTFISILTSQGISMSDALYAAKKADRKILRGIRPGGELDLKMKPGRPAVIEIGYSSPASKRKIIYSGKALPINPDMKAGASRPGQKIISKAPAPAEAEKGNPVSLPGMSPEEISGNILSAADSTFNSVFNAPPDVQTRIKNEVKESDKQLLKIKREKKNLKLATIKRQNKRIPAGRKTRDSSSYSYSQKKRSAILASSDDYETGRYTDDDGNTEITENPELREKLINVADTYKGVPYRRGSASSNATDCSGLTMQVYRDMGYNLPRSSREQFRIGTPKKKGELEKGDLVFFSTNSPYKKIKVRSKKNPKKKIVKYIKAPRRITHVGIYVGDGKFIHAPRPGHSVTIESLDTGYYKKNYVGARSVIR